MTNSISAERLASGGKTHRFVALFTLVIALAILPSGCGRAEQQVGFQVFDNQTRFAIEVGGRRRTGSLHVPLLYEDDKPQALLFALHGAGSSGEEFRALGFDALANELGFIVVYPNGIGRRWDAPEDLAFFQSMMDEIPKRYAIDPARVYITGHSAGAIRAYELACFLGPRVAAVAPVAGLMRADIAGAAPVSVLHLHAMDDKEVPFEGLPAWGFRSAEESIRFWRRANGGPGTPIPDWVPIPQKARRAEEEAGSVFFSERGIEGVLWRGAGADTARVFYRGGGHAWPPLATELIMDFFYQRPARAASVRLERERIPQIAQANGPIRLGAHAEPANAVRSVSFFAGAEKIGTDERSPFEIDWTIPRPGMYRLSAVATLAAGGEIRSTLNPFILATPPSAGKTGEAALPCATATSSSDETSSLGARFATDGALTTRWSSGWKDGESLTLDLGEERLVSAVTIAWESAYARRYAIEVSLDGTDWKRVATRDDGAGGVEVSSFDPTRAKLVRFVGTERATEWGFSFWEILVHGE